MSTELWSAYASRGSVLTTELNALTNGSTTAAGPAYDNTTNLDVYGIAMLLTGAAFGTAPTLDAPIELYALRSVDGTNYEDGSSTVRPPYASYLGSFQCYNQNSTAQRLITPPFQLLPGKMKFIVVNRSGQTLPATLNVVSLYTFNRTAS